MFKLFVFVLVAIMAVVAVSADQWDAIKKNQAEFVQTSKDTIGTFRTNIAKNWLGEDSPEAAQYLTPLTDAVYGKFLKELLQAQKDNQ